MKLLFYAVSLLSLFNYPREEKTTPSALSDTDQTAVSTARIHQTEALADKPIPKNSSSSRAGTWAYEETTDKAGDKVYKASVISPDTLQFGFPYAGGATATLTIRKRSSGTNVYIQVSKGQFNRSFQGGEARIRFDGKAPVTYAYSAAENGRANIIFFDSEQKLIAKIKSTKEMTVDVGFYGQGTRQIKFKTAGLTWNH